jgi:hypothetical protein
MYDVRNTCDPRGHLGPEQAPAGTPIASGYKPALIPSQFNSTGLHLLNSIPYFNTQSPFQGWRRLLSVTFRLQWLGSDKVTSRNAALDSSGPAFLRLPDQMGGTSGRATELIS